MPSRTFLAVLILASAACSQAPAPKIPPAINIPDALMEGKLLTTHRRQIENRIRWWKQKFIHATSDEDVQAARNGLLGDYGYSENPHFRDAFVEATVKEFMDLLKGEGTQENSPLGLEIRINVALALAEMPYLPAQPALEFMTASPNQALQYVGWQGYMRLRNALLQKGGKAMATVAATLKKAVADTRNPLILSLLFEFMNLAQAEDKRQLAHF